MRSQSWTGLSRSAGIHEGTEGMVPRSCWRTQSCWSTGPDGIRERYSAPLIHQAGSIARLSGPGSGDFTDQAPKVCSTPRYVAIHTGFYGPIIHSFALYQSVYFYSELSSGSLDTRVGMRTFTNAAGAMSCRWPASPSSGTYPPHGPERTLRVGAKRSSSTEGSCA